MRRLALLTTFCMGCVTAFWVGQVHRRVGAAATALTARGSFAHAFELFASPSTDLWVIPCRAGCIAFASNDLVEPRLTTASGAPFTAITDPASPLRIDFDVSDAGTIPVLLSWTPKTFDPGVGLEWSACDWDDPDPAHRATARLPGNRVQLPVTLHADTDEPFLTP